MFATLTPSDIAGVYLAIPISDKDNNISSALRTFVYAPHSFITRYLSKSFMAIPNKTIAV
jgi:hypothetical protein